MKWIHVRRTSDVVQYGPIWWSIMKWIHVRRTSDVVQYGPMWWSIMKCGLVRPDVVVHNEVDTREEDI